MSDVFNGDIMSHENLEDRRINYIEGIRGIACILIMNGHFMGIVKYCTTSIPNCSLNYIEKSVFSILINETWWLYCFFVISGYCLSISCITKFSVLIVKIIKRFFRLVLPIIGACIYIYAIYKIIGFHNNKTEILFTNLWYQNSYSANLSWMDVILDPIHTVLKGGSKFNSPYWCIHDMFVISILIMVCNLLKNRFCSSKNLISLLIICWCIRKNTIYQACICGMLCQWYEKEFCKIIRYKWVAGILMGICWILMLHQIRNDLGMIFCSVLLLVVPYFSGIEKFLKSTIFVKLGSISFGIYSFHWPMFCSVGALLQLYLYELLPIDVVLILVFTVTGILTIILSYVYNITVERLLYKSIDNICDYINKNFIL